MNLIKTFLFCMYLGVACSCYAKALRTVALSGTQAPGAEDETVFSSFWSLGPDLNNQGQVAFKAFARSLSENSNAGGIWSEGEQGQLDLVALSGGSILENETELTLSFSINQDIGFNDLGQTAFLSSYSSNGLRNSAIWIHEPGTGLRAFAKGGDTVVGPDLQVNTFDSFSTPLLNNVGDLAFFASSSGSSQDRYGIWTGSDLSNLRYAVGRGDVAPGTDGKATFSSFMAVDSLTQRIFALNDAGQIAVESYITGEDVTFENSYGIWSEGRGNGLELIARNGERSPGLDIEYIFDYFSRIEFNNAGHLLYRGAASAPGNVGTVFGTWLDRGENDASLVDGIGPFDLEDTEAAYIALLGARTFNNSSEVLLNVRLEGEQVTSNNDQALVVARDHGLSLVVREGDIAPGTGGVAFTGSYRETAINDAGQVAFYTSAAGLFSASGIWAEDRSGVLRLIAKTGDLIDVNDGTGVDLRQISSLRFLNDERVADGRTGGFNNLGQLAFWASFTDGTEGIFVSNIGTIPEPSAMVLLSLALLGCLARRGRLANACGSDS